MKAKTTERPQVWEAGEGAATLIYIHSLLWGHLQWRNYSGNTGQYRDQSACLKQLSPKMFHPKVCLAKNKLARAVDVFWRKGTLMKMETPENCPMKEMEAWRDGSVVKAFFLAEGWGSILNTHMVAYNHLWLQLLGSDALFDIHRQHANMWSTHTLRQNTHKIKINKSKTKF